MAARTIDVCVVGAGPAGLSAASLFSRLRSGVAVIDSKDSRLKRAAKPQGLPSSFGMTADTYLDSARGYITRTDSSITFFHGTVIKIAKVERTSGEPRFKITFRKFPEPTAEPATEPAGLKKKRVRFEKEVEEEESEKEEKEEKKNMMLKGIEVTGERGSITCKRVILAMGSQDKLYPAFPGLFECWGSGIVPSPSFADLSSSRPPTVGVLAVGLLADPAKCFEVARQFSTLAETVNIYTNGVKGFEGMKVRKHIGTSVRGQFTFAHTFKFVEWKIAALEKLPEGAAVLVKFTNGKEKKEFVLGCVFRTEVRGSHLVEELGLRMKVGETGQNVWVSGTGETSIKGVWAVGDISSGKKCVSGAVFTGELAAEEAVRDKVYNRFGPYQAIV